MVLTWYELLTYVMVLAGVLGVFFMPYKNRVVIALLGIGAVGFLEWGFLIAESGRIFWASVVFEWTIIMFISMRCIIFDYHWLRDRYPAIN